MLLGKQKASWRTSRFGQQFSPKPHKYLIFSTRNIASIQKWKENFLDKCISLHQQHLSNQNMQCDDSNERFSGVT